MSAWSPHYLSSASLLQPDHPFKAQHKTSSRHSSFGSQLNFTLRTTGHTAKSYFPSDCINELRRRFLPLRDDHRVLSHLLPRLHRQRVLPRCQNHSTPPRPLPTLNKSTMTAAPLPHPHPLTTPTAASTTPRTHPTIPARAPNTPVPPLQAGHTVPQDHTTATT